MWNLHYVSRLFRDILKGDNFFTEIQFLYSNLLNCIKSVAYAKFFIHL